MQWRINCYFLLSYLGLPFIGNSLSFGAFPHLTWTKWKDTFGDVMTLYNGRQRFIVLSDPATVKKVFADDVVAYRDNDSEIRTGPETGKELGLIFSEGSLWKTHRRFALSTLRDLGMGKNWLEDTIIAEVEELCSALRESKQVSGTVCFFYKKSKSTFLLIATKIETFYPPQIT